VQTFELSALDYLLKPVTGPRFARALARAKAQLHQRTAAGTGDQIRPGLRRLARTASRAARPTALDLPAPPADRAAA
jgi:two-component SAPR family response regulator